MGAPDVGKSHGSSNTMKNQTCLHGERGRHETEDQTVGTLPCRALVPGGVSSLPAPKQPGQSCIFPVAWPTAFRQGNLHHTHLAGRQPTGHCGASWQEAGKCAERTVVAPSFPFFHCKATQGSVCFSSWACLCEWSADSLLKSPHSGQAF